MSKDKTEAPAFERTVLIAQAHKLFKVAPEVVAGALYGVNKPITIEAAKEKVEDFLARPVAKEGGK